MSADRPQGVTGRGLLSRALAALRSKRGRRVLLILAVAILAIVVFVVVPGWLASQPQFFQRYDTMSGKYRTWAKSLHAQATCQSCHIAPDWISQGIFSLRMPGEFYLSYLMPSRQPSLFGTPPANAACMSCHTDLRKISPSGDLNIPHRAHVSVLKLKCVQCHSYLVHEKNPQGTNKPTMAGCLKCHDGHTAKNNCAACHTEKALPDNHKAADWITVHPQKQKEIDCAKCHGWTKDWCAQCHSTRPRSHTKTWRSDHGQRVKTRRDCEVCHQASFCIRCHGQVPTLNFDPKVKLVR